MHTDREQKSGGRLNGQRGADRVRRHGFRDERAELRGVRDHEEAPGQRERREQPERLSEGRTASAARRLPLSAMRDDDETLASSSRPRRARPRRIRCLRRRSCRTRPATTETHVCGSRAIPPATSSAAMNSGIHVQNEYSSNMWPRYPPVARRHSVPRDDRRAPAPMRTVAAETGTDRRRRRTRPAARPSARTPMP